MEEIILQIAEQINQLYKKVYYIYLPLVDDVCRTYLYIYPSCVKCYIDAYQEMWEDENDSLTEYLTEENIF